MDWLDLVQWPAMLVTLIAAYFVGSGREDRRWAGFWFFIASNLLWVVWGWHTSAYALIALQFGLAAMNIRGMRKNDREAG